MNRNYQKEMERVIAGWDREKRPTLLLHSCCAPCSSHVLESLNEFFRITVFYYNPNIYPEEEYEKRVREQEAFLKKMPFAHPPAFIEGSYDKEKFYEMARGLEEEKEGAARCFRCYELRLRKTARLASEKGFDFFTTTLTISPMKNAAKLNEIGERLAEEYGICWLPSDFKKKNGYKRSVELSKEYGLYRQDYCGCVFSKRERRLQERSRACGREGSMVQ